jgi:NADH-quinone oxidoreductase subunit N
VRLATGFAYSPDPTALALLENVRHYIAALLALLAAVTCTFGNLAAYGQTNMKRLLAYSTIAHAGYMMMPVAAAVTLIGVDVEGAQSAIAALVVYIGVYLFMNLAAFAIVAFLRNVIHSEEIADYAGLVRTSPGLTVCMAIVLFSLVGLPPLAGFSAKMTIFLALIHAKLWVLLFVGALNTVLSLFYYLRVVRVMVISPEPLHRPAPVIPLSSMVGSYCAMLTLPVVLLFFCLGSLLNWANAAASTLFH